MNSTTFREFMLQHFGGRISQSPSWAPVAEGWLEEMKFDATGLFTAEELENALRSHYEARGVSVECTNREFGIWSLKTGEGHACYVTTTTTPLMLQISVVPL